MSEVLYLDQGRVTIPKHSRKRQGLENGDTLIFLETKSGAMVLKPANSRPKLTLWEHLKKFRDVEIPEREVHCKPRL